MLAVVLAFVKKRPALCAIIGLVLILLGMGAYAKRLKTQRDRAKWEADDAHHEERIKIAREKRNEAEARGDALRAEKAQIEEKREDKLKSEKKRHRERLDEIEDKHEKDKANLSDADFFASRR